MPDDGTYQEERTLSQNSAKWRKDLDYWKRKGPAVYLNHEQNTHIPSRALRIPWNPATMGLAPLVNLEFIPQKKPLPSLGFLAENTWIASLGTVALSAIPVVGTALSIVGGLAATGTAIYMQKEYAKELQKIPPSQFMPQYHPEPFTVPVPLDRAQLILKEPWIGPAMIEGFANEWNAGSIGNARDAYLSINPTGSNILGIRPVQSSSPNVPQGTFSEFLAPVAIGLIGIALITAALARKRKTR